MRIYIRRTEQIFQNAAKTLNFNGTSYIEDSSYTIVDPINTFENSPSILLMKKEIGNMGQFSLKEVFNWRINEELNYIKGTRFGNISTKTLKQSSKSCSDKFQKQFNYEIRHGNFS